MVVWFDGWVFGYPGVSDGAGFVEDEYAAFCDGVIFESGEVWVFKVVCFGDLAVVVAEDGEG